MSEENKKTATDLSRRRLAKAALVAAPVLAVLPGKPAMALYKKNNCTVSGNMSGNMSDAAVADDECSNITHGYKPSVRIVNPNWPAGMDGTEAFNIIFNDVSVTNVDSLASVLSLGDWNLEAQAVASYLNSEDVGGYGMLTTDVVNSYIDHHPGGLDPQAYELLSTYQYLNGMTW